MMYPERQEVNAMSTYTTGEIAKLCGVSVRTVQYYDTRGILAPTELSEGGRRLYSEEDLSKMKIICFLRELDISLDNIAKLMHEKNSKDVIELILEEQRVQLEEERAEKDQKLAKLKELKELRQLLDKNEQFSVESIGDVAHIMENKKKMQKLHITLVLMGIPMTVAEWGTIVLWIMTGIFWPFLVYTALDIPFAIWISRYYFARVAYICPQCHEIFVPKFRQAFWANHTSTTRKLTCTRCGCKGFCVETYRDPTKAAKKAETN